MHEIKSRNRIQEKAAHLKGPSRKESCVGGRFGEGTGCIGNHRQTGSAEFR